LDSRELGLVLARQLIGVDDLHYGLWGDGLALNLGNLAYAQQRYNEMLLRELPPADVEVRVLDVGCGTGTLLCQMARRGYRVDGVVPAAYLCRAARERIAADGASASRIFPCRFEDLPVPMLQSNYDVVLFSESFQYVPLRAVLSTVPRLLKPGGTLLISDFFKTDAEGDGLPGDRSFRGGHSLTRFREQMRATPFVLVKDEDITSRVSPNLELVDELLMKRAKPALEAIRTYLLHRHPILARLAFRLFRKKLATLEYKYFSGHRNRAVFERYKSYRLMVWQFSRTAGLLESRQDIADRPPGH